MNAVFNLSPLVRVGIAIAAISMLAACGQRGPLYLPKGETSTMISRPTIGVTNPNATPGSANAASSSSASSSASTTANTDATNKTSQDNQQK